MNRVEVYSFVNERGYELFRAPRFSTLTLPEMHERMAATTSGREANYAQYLYRARDSGGRLLYVGVTWDLRLRMRVHSRHAAWWPEVATFDLELFFTRHEALRAERAAIGHEMPIYNRVRPNPRARRAKYSALRSQLAEALGEDPATYGQRLRQEDYTSWAGVSGHIADLASLSDADRLRLREALPAWVRTAEDQLAA